MAPKIHTLITRLPSVSVYDSRVTDVERTSGRKVHIPRLSPGMGTPMYCIFATIDEGFVAGVRSSASVSLRVHFPHGDGAEHRRTFHALIWPFVCASSSMIYESLPMGEGRLTHVTLVGFLMSGDHEMSDD